MVKAHLLLRLSIKDLSIGGAEGALLNLFWIFDHTTTWPFGGLLSADYPGDEKVQNISVAMGIWNFEPKIGREV